METQREKNKNNINLNLTIGVFEIPLVTLFDEDDDGNVYPVLKSVRKLLDLITFYGNFNREIVVSRDGQFGRLTANGYEDGVLGMLQRGEVDLCWLPIPLHTPQPPGRFTPLLVADNYYLNSLPRSSSFINQDVIGSFTIFLPSTWIFILATIYFFEIILAYQKSHLSSFTWTNLVISVESLPCVLFKQYIPNRSMIRSAQLLLLAIMMALFEASFNTNTISGTSDARVNSLRDIVNLDKTPCFVEGISMFELFEARVTKDYADVYDLAVRKGTAEATALGARSHYSSHSSEVVLIVSEMTGRFGNSIEGTDHPMAKYSYWSDKPFYQALEAFLTRPRQNFDQINQRLKSIGTRLSQSAILYRLLTEIISDVALMIPFRNLKRIHLIKRTMKPKKETKFMPLKIDGLKYVFIGLSMAIFGALIICLLEITVFKIFHN